MPASCPDGDEAYLPGFVFPRVKHVFKAATREETVLPTFLSSDPTSQGLFRAIEYC